MKEPGSGTQTAHTSQDARVPATALLTPGSWKTQVQALSPEEMQEIKRLETTITTRIVSAPAPAVFSVFAFGLWNPTCLLCSARGLRIFLTWCRARPHCVRVLLRSRARRAPEAGAGVGCPRRQGGAVP